jgi:dsDNA-specific endonuclease/ATPase MutS2
MTDMKKSGTVRKVKAVDVEAMQRKGWTVVIAEEKEKEKPKPKPKAKKKQVNEYKPPLEDDDNGDT